MKPIKAANDNTARKTEWPLLELYKKGELGINEIENRNHWRDAQRFLRAIKLSRDEPLNESVGTEWRELKPAHIEFSADAGIVPMSESDDEPFLNDDMDWEDALPDGNDDLFDNAGWNPYRDLPLGLDAVHAKQILALAADVLGPHYPVLCAAVDRGWTIRDLGETEGFKDRASASACGKGMLRYALRSLTAFYLALDRFEQDAVPAQTLWPLVGTNAWRFVETPDARWKRTAEALPKMDQYLAA